MIRLHSTGLNDATILSNIFIDRFMPKANGEFVKVYIYLLRMLGRPEEAFGLSQMADSLFCTEGDILRALKYWESEKLITLLYEEAELTGTERSCAGRTGTAAVQHGISGEQEAGA